MDILKQLHVEEKGLSLTEEYASVKADEIIGQLPDNDNVDITQRLKEAKNLTQTTEAYRDVGKLVVTRAELEEALATNANTFTFEEKKVEEREYFDIYYEHKDRYISSTTLRANEFKDVVNDIVKDTIEKHGKEYLTPKHGFVRLPTKNVVNTFIEKFELTLIKTNTSFYVNPQGEKMYYDDGDNKHILTPESIIFDALDYYAKTDYSVIYLVDKVLIDAIAKDLIPVGTSHGTIKQYTESKLSEYGSFKPKFYTDLYELLKVSYYVSIPKFISIETFEDNNVIAPSTIINDSVINDSNVGVPVKITLRKIITYVADGIRVHFLNPKDIMPLLADVEHSLMKLKNQRDLRNIRPALFELEDEANEFMEEMLENKILPYLVAIGRQDDVEELYEQIAPTQPNPYLKNVSKQLEESKDLFYGVETVDNVDKATGIRASIDGKLRSNGSDDNTTLLDNGIDLDYTSDTYSDVSVYQPSVNEMSQSVTNETTFQAKRMGRDMSLTYNLLNI